MSTLARLAISVRPEADDAFDALYAAHAGILAHQGLRGAGDSQKVLTRWGSWAHFQDFDLPDVAAVDRCRAALEGDPAWQRLFDRDIASPAALGWALDVRRSTPGDGLRRTAGPGRSRPAGPGTPVRLGGGVRRGAWRSFGLLDGMPECIAGIAEDRRGDLWFSTRGIDATPGEGLWRFDGGALRRFTTADGLPHDEVTCVLENASGALWIGTVGGLCRYDGESFTTFTVDDGLVDDRVACLHADGAGRLWVGTLGGLSRYDGQTFTHLTTAHGLPVDRVTCIAETPDGCLWLGGGWDAPTEYGLLRYDGQTLERFTILDGLVSEWVLSLLVDADGQLWVGHNDGVSRLAGSAIAKAFVTDLRQFIGGVMAIAPARDGGRWLAVWARGLLRDGPTGRVRITSRDGLAADEATSLCVDRHGQLWVGTQGSGLSVWQGEQLTLYDEASGLPDPCVTNLARDGLGRLWVGTRGGLCCRDGETLRVVDDTRERPAFRVLVDRSGRVWFGVPARGLGCWDGESVETRGPGGDLYHTYVTEPLLEDRDGVLWFVTRDEQGGLSRYDGRDWMPYGENVGLVPSRVRCLLQTGDGGLWFGGEGGLSRRDGAVLDTFTTADGLVHATVTALTEDGEGGLWVGTEGGLAHFDGAAFRTFTVDDGLPHPTVWCLMVDDEGRLWVGTRGGVCRFDGTVFQTLSCRDGLPHDEVFDVLRGDEGSVWLATRRGLVHYRPTAATPRVEITAVVADRTHPPADRVRVPASQQVIAFEFAGRSLTTPTERLAYLFQLEGHDPDWRAAYDTRVRYQGLPVGDYRFRVRAIDRDLNRSAAAEVRLTVEPDLRVEGLTEALREAGPGGEFVGQSAALQRVYRQLEQVAPADLTVLISGETGTGKGLAARVLHELGPRQDAPFIQVNCGAIPEALVEAELFGHERGAFTGAMARRLGKVELASGGTLFLDEIGDMPLAAQVKLLRLLEERTFERVGGAEVLHADVRVVAATNRELRRMVDDGAFRQDLYFRLLGFEVRVPPLRERRDDIRLLALYFIGPQAAHLGKEVTGISRAAEAALLAHDWPGNVRELQHAIERAVIVCPGGAIEVEHLSLGDRAPQAAPATGAATLREVERRHILAVLEDVGWRVAGPHGAATVLGLKESTLRARMKKLGIRRS